LVRSALGLITVGVPSASVLGSFLLTNLFLHRFQFVVVGWVLKPHANISESAPVKNPADYEFNDITAGFGADLPFLAILMAENLPRLREDLG
jgi:hypothetical protein